MLKESPQRLIRTLSHGTQSLAQSLTSSKLKNRLLLPSRLLILPAFYLVEWAVSMTSLLIQNLWGMLRVQQMNVSTKKGTAYSHVLRTKAANLGRYGGLLTVGVN